LKDASRLYMGGGGGGGGDDTDIGGAQGGAGDNGGGIIIIEANKINFDSASTGIESQGSTGDTGSSDGGGGGGGAGGMIWLRANTISALNATTSDYIHVGGGTGGTHQEQVQPVELEHRDLHSHRRIILMAVS
jgi:hypothetical protein